LLSVHRAESLVATSHRRSPYAMEFSEMQRFIRPLIVVTLAASLGACATKPEPQPDPAAYDLKAPPKKPLDAKTQLETGRRY